MDSVHRGVVVAGDVAGRPRPGRNVAGCAGTGGRSSRWSCSSSPSPRGSCSRSQRQGRAPPRRLPLRDRRRLARADRGARDRHRHPVGAGDRPGGQPGLRPHPVARRRLQHPGAEGTGDRPHRPVALSAAVEQARAKVRTACRANLELAAAQLADAQTQTERDRARRRQSLVSQATLDDARPPPGSRRPRSAPPPRSRPMRRATLHQAEINLAYTDHRLAHRRRWSSPATWTSGRPSPPRCRRPPCSLIAAGPPQDAGGHQRRRGRRGHARTPGMTATFTVDAYPASPSAGAIRADPQRAADGAERGHLRRGDRRGQPRAQAPAGDDRQRHRGLRRPARRRSGCPTPRCASGRRRRCSSAAPELRRRCRADQRAGLGRCADGQAAVRSPSGSASATEL